MTPDALHITIAKSDNQGAMEELFCADCASETLGKAVRALAEELFDGGEGAFHDRWGRPCPRRARATLNEALAHRGYDCPPRHSDMRRIKRGAGRKGPLGSRSPAAAVDPLLTLHGDFRVKLATHATCSFGRTGCRESCLLVPGGTKLMILPSLQRRVALAAVLLLLPGVSVADGLARAAKVVTSTDIPIPAEAQAQGHYGTVRVAGVIDETGSVVNASISQSSRSPILDAAALSGVSDWKFTPALDSEGHPVSKKFQTDVDFDPLDMADFPSYTCRKVTVETDWYMQAFPEKGNNESRMYPLVLGMGAILGRAEIPSDPTKFKNAWDKTISACRSSPRAIFIKKFIEQAR